MSGDFDVIESGFNAADETINFGDRCLADEGNLHETATLALLKCSTEPQVNGVKHFNGIVKNGKIHLTVNKSFKVFSECGEVISTASFSNVIDNICFTSDGKSVLLSLRNGAVFLLDSEDFQCITKGVVEKETEIDDAKSYFINTFVEHNTRQNSFLLITSSGRLIRVTLTPENTMNIEIILEFGFKIEIASYSFPFLIVNGVNLSCYNTIRDEEIKEENTNLDIVYMFPCGRNFLCLNSEGQLFTIHSNNLFIDHAENSVAHNHASALYDDVNEITALIDIKPTDADNILEMISYPSGELIFTMKVPDKIHLITPEFHHDEILFLSEVDGNELRLQKIYETEPQKRFERLLRKKQYHEAEMFAKMHCLDESIINKAKITMILEKQSCDSDDIDSFLDHLKDLKDGVFVYQSILALEISCNNYGDLERVLSFSRSYKPKEKDIKNEEMQKQINEISHRLVTFDLLFGKAQYTLDKWNNFSNSSLMSYILSSLNNDHIEQAALAYSRLSPRDCENLDLNIIKNILYILHSKPIEAHQCFLPTFINITLNVSSAALKCFARFVKKTVFHLERFGRGRFPDNALEYMTLIVNVICEYSRNELDFNEYTKNVGQLFKALKMLKTLNQEYFINMSLSKFLKDPEDVINILLEVDTTTEIYEKLVKQFLVPFITENNLDPNEIFQLKIMELNQCVSNQHVKYGVLLDCIKCISTKLKTTVQILGAATAPWSEEIRKIATNALTYDDQEYPEIPIIKDIIRNEPIKIVLQKREYLIKKRHVDNLDDFEWFVRRIIYCNTPSMVEDVYTLCIQEKFRHTANVFLMKHFISQGAYDEAVAIIMNNSAEEILACTEHFLCYYQVLLDTPNSNAELRKHYYRMAPLIVSKSEQSSRQVAIMRKIQEIKEVFGVDSNYHGISNPVRENAVIDEIIESIDANDEDAALSKCYKISSIFSRDRGEVLTRCASQIGDLEFVCGVAEDLLNSDESEARYLRECSLLLLKSLNNTSRFADFTFSEDLKITDQSEVFGKALDLSHKLMAKCLVNEDEEEGFLTLETLKWTRTASAIHAGILNDTGMVFDKNNLLLGQFMGRILSMLYPAGITVETIDFNLHQDDLLREISSGLTMLDILFREHQYYMLYEILTNLREHIFVKSTKNATSSHLCQYLGETVKKRCITPLLEAIIRSDNFDTDLLYNVASKWLSKEEVNAIVKYALLVCRKRPLKFEASLNVSLKLSDRFHITLYKEAITNSLITMKWWKKLNVNTLTSQQFFKSTPEERLVLLLDLNLIDINSVSEYCIDFHLEYQSAYETYLKTILYDSKLDYEIEIVNNEKKLLVKQSYKSLVNKCLPVIELMDKAGVLRILKLYKMCGNHYYYEVFVAVFELLNMFELEESEAHMTEKELLRFCRNYQRSRQPGEVEIQLWYERFPESKSLDPLSEFRLPFNSNGSKENIKGIIRPEICLKNYEIWFGALPALKDSLSKDDICVYAIKDMVYSGVVSKQRKDLNLLQADDILLKKVGDCVEHIDNLEIASSVLYFLMRNMPEGEAQVNVAFLCYQYANKYKNSHPVISVDIEKSIAKVRKEYYIVSATHILRKYNLMCDKYLDVITKPSHLVEALYMDESIVSKGMNRVSEDINRAVSSLAILFALDIEAIRKKLINKWMSDYISTILRSLNGPNESYLLRAAYCCMSDQHYWQDNLVKLAFTNADNSITINEDQSRSFSKAIALKVFCMISDDETIQSEWNMNATDLLKFSDKLIIVGCLCQYGHKFDLDKLDSCNKHELMKIVARQSKDAAMLRIMAMICMTYDIYNIYFWEFIIKNALCFSMFSDIKTYLNFLSKETHFYSKGFFIQAWQSVIDHIFIKLELGADSSPISSILMIQSCPVIESIEFDRIIKRCISLGYLEVAAILLQYHRRDYSEILTEIRKRDLNLDYLRLHGVLGVDKVKQLLKTI